MNIIQNIEGFLRDFPQYEPLRTRLANRTPAIGWLDSVGGTIFYRQDLLICYAKALVAEDKASARSASPPASANGGP